MKKRLSARQKKGFFVLVAVLSVLASCAALYVGIESFVAYEEVTTESLAVNKKRSDIAHTQTPSDLPFSEFYTLRLVNGTLCVFDAQNAEIYRENNFSSSALSAEDIAELERDGLTLTARSEVIELLTYLKS